MDFTFGQSSTFLIACIYIIVLSSPAYAKCRGRWAIHACHGGNGKRSDPSLDSSSANLKPSLLHQVLVTNIERLMQNDNGDVLPSIVLSDPPYPESMDYERRETEKLGDTGFIRQLMPSETRDITQYRRYLRNMRLQKRLRDREMALL